jgi:hypothetical protein
MPPKLGQEVVGLMPVITAALAFPVPSIAAAPVKVRFSTSPTE